MKIYYDYRYERLNINFDKKFVIYKIRFIMKNIYNI